MFLALILAALTYRITEGFMSANICKGSFSQLWNEEVLIMVCGFLLRVMKVKRESEVAQSCPTLSDPMDCSLPGSSVHEIFQARVLEWGATAIS